MYIDILNKKLQDSNSDYQIREITDDLVKVIYDNKSIINYDFKVFSERVNIDYNLLLTINEFNKYSVQMVLIENRMLRFVGIAEDDIDHLYVFYDGRKLLTYSVLCRLIPLKDFLSAEDYNYLVKMNRLNSYDYMVQDSIYEKEHRNTLEKFFSEKYGIIDFSWDLK
jgi:hypothetical protein